MLGKLIPRLGSNHDGEVVATVRAIRRVLDSAGVRKEIAGLRQQLVTVKAAPLPLDDMRELVESFVVELMRRGQPGVAIVGDKLRVLFRGDMAAPEDVLALLAWAAPEQVCRALEREVGKLLPVRADALPPQERIRLLAELEAQLLDRERYESALIESARESGVEILFRADADPSAVLGVVVATVQAQAVA
jgi:hypothetical protein